MFIKDEELFAQLTSSAPEMALLKRRAIAKIITLFESTLIDHRQRADSLLEKMLPRVGKSLRIGISGVPGVGKSTLIETFGLYLIEKGFRVAVLAIDPSSTISGGSILGDKTRMEKLTVNDHAFIRPSPSSGNLGGVAEKTREAILVLEAAGFDLIIVETVGVGQSEIAVSKMTDMFVLLQLPNAGDELQAIKKGVMEVADLVVINKSDIDPSAATRALSQIKSSLRIFGYQGNPHHQLHNQEVWHPEAICLSALDEHQVANLWEVIFRFQSIQTSNGQFIHRRSEQALSWMDDQINQGLKELLKNHPVVKEKYLQYQTKVHAGLLDPSVAARNLLDIFKYE
jgi:LAO/AO transport system kinase